MSASGIYNLIMMFSLVVVMVGSTLIGFTTEQTTLSVNVTGFGLLANMIGSIHDRA